MKKAFFFEIFSRIMERRVKPCQPVKEKPNVLMFVGLQGFGKTPSPSATPLPPSIPYYTTGAWRKRKIEARLDLVHTVDIDFDYRQSLKEAQILGWEINIKDQIIVKNKNPTSRIEQIAGNLVVSVLMTLSVSLHTTSWSKMPQKPESHFMAVIQRSIPLSS